jgi:hypothetical protein
VFHPYCPMVKKNCGFAISELNQINLRICDLQHKKKLLIWYFELLINVQICDSRMSPRIFGFANCPTMIYFQNFVLRWTSWKYIFLEIYGHNLGILYGLSFCLFYKVIFLTGWKGTFSAIKNIDEKLAFHKGYFSATFLPVFKEFGIST